MNNVIRDHPVGPRRERVLLRRRAGLLTTNFLTIVGSTCALSGVGGWFARGWFDAPEAPGSRCLQLSCAAPKDPRNPNKRSPIWQEEVCQGAECYAVAQACVKTIFPPDLFMPGSRCGVVEMAPGECRPARKWKTEKFNLDAIDRLGDRWRKGKGKR